MWTIVWVHFSGLFWFSDIHFRVICQTRVRHIPRQTSKFFDNSNSPSFINSMNPLIRSSILALSYPIEVVLSWAKDDLLAIKWPCFHEFGNLRTFSLPPMNIEALRSTRFAYCVSFTAVHMRLYGLSRYAFHSASSRSVVWGRSFFVGAWCTTSFIPISRGTSSYKLPFRQYAKNSICGLQCARSEERRVGKEC